MNERIRELAFKASNGILSYDGEGEWRLSQKEVEKFAELIVRECAEVIDEKISPPSHLMNSIGYKLKEHFGVE